MGLVLDEAQLREVIDALEKQHEIRRSILIASAHKDLLSYQARELPSTIQKVNGVTGKFFEALKAPASDQGVQRPPKPGETTPSVRPRIPDNAPETLKVARRAIYQLQSFEQSVYEGERPHRQALSKVVVARTVAESLQKTAHPADPWRVVSATDPRRTDSTSTPASADPRRRPSIPTVQSPSLGIPTTPVFAPPTPGAMTENNRVDETRDPRKKRG
ncbi:hypothetical protein LTS18_003265 [Coniosporium uncinatum]|uniref:Uncharacterized protein n=1 Tax=Coniosporium uncinatum TaxID=93489 RepID=A0ACC3DU29_9PEZI|nr:hypothetical protein LTS18_003265 [Coniosporium uncinatum]